MEREPPAKTNLMQTTNNQAVAVTRAIQGHVSTTVLYSVAIHRRLCLIMCSRRAWQAAGVADIAFDATATSSLEENMYMVVSLVIAWQDDLKPLERYRRKPFIEMLAIANT